MTQTNLERLPEATPEEPSKKKLEIPLIALVALTLSLAAPIAALVGYFFLHGYLSAFGLNAGFFPRSFQEHVLGSFTALIHLVGLLQQSLGLKNMMAWVALGVALLVYMKFLDVFSYYIKRLIAWVRPLVKDRNLKGVGQRVAQLAVFVGLPGLCFIILLLAILPSLGAFLVGKGAAKDTIREFPGCNDPQPYKCAKLYDNGTLIAEGLIIEASDKLVAIYDNSTARLLPLTPTSVLEVSLERPSAK